MPPMALILWQDCNINLRNIKQAMCCNKCAAHRKTDTASLQHSTYYIALS